MKPTEISMHKASLVVGILALGVYASGAFLLLMEPDATTYALVTMEMFDRGDYLNITLRGKDWLDKPHLHFWLTAPFYALLGVNSFAYRLPSLLVFLLGLWYTYLFGRKFYDAQTGLLACVLLMTAFHILLSNNDVRAEPILTGFTILAMYHSASYLQEKKVKYLLLACLGLGLLMMTKGPFTILPVVGGVGLSLLYDRKWKEIFHPQWLLVALCTLVALAPVLWAYYVQFDLHPEKEIFGKKGVSGIRFFLWESQWGRFTNSGPIKGAGEPTFFLHTLLWAFAPWAFLAYFALFKKTRALILGKNDRENYTFFGFFSLFLVFSISKFQLPHYLNNLYPLLALVCADQIIKSQNTLFFKVFGWIQGVQIFLFFVLIFLAQYFFIARWFNADTVMVLLLAIMAIFYILRSYATLLRLVLPSALSILCLGYFLNREFYPILFPYQSETQLAFYIQKNQIKGNLASFYIVERSTDFYLHRTLPDLSMQEMKALPPGWMIFTHQDGLKEIQNEGLQYEVLKTFPDFHITGLTLPFLYQKTRADNLEKTYLLHLKAHSAE